MEAETHSKAEAVALFKGYVNVKVDYEKDKPTAGGFAIRSFPGTAIVGAGGETLLVLSGFYALNDLLAAVKGAPAARAKLGELTGKSDPGSLREVADAHRLLEEHDKAAPLYQQALDALPVRVSKVERRFAAETLRALLELQVREFRFAYKPKTVASLEMAATRLDEADPKNEFDSGDDVAAARALALLKMEKNAEAQAAADACLARFPKSDVLPRMLYVAAASRLFQDRRPAAEPFLKRLVETAPETAMGNWASRLLKTR